MVLTPFNSGWRFHLGELSMPPRRLVAKASLSGGFSDLVLDEIIKKAPARDENVSGTIGEQQQELANIVLAEPEDGQFWTEPTPATLPKKKWSYVDLPHDWTAEHSPHQGHPHRTDYPFATQGSHMLATAYYRKTWSQSLPQDGQRVFLQLDAVMNNSDVWFNGFWLGGQISGYTKARYELTEMLRDPKDADGKTSNILLVRCDNLEAEGWWNEGGGIYRDAWLDTLDEIHITPDGVNVVVESATTDVAKVTIITELANTSDLRQVVQIKSRICDPNGRHVAEVSTSIEMSPEEKAEGIAEAEIASPQLWSIGQGHLYTIATTLEYSTKKTNALPTKSCFGIRTISFSPNGLFMLNNKHVVIQGANIHQDFAGLGSALPPSVIAYKLGLLIDMGCNLVRVAHNPPSSHLLSVASRLGLMVITENRLLSLAAPYKADLVSLIRSTRLEPSCVIYSLANEEFALEGTAVGTRLIHSCVRIIRSLDPANRPTIIAAATHAGSPTPYFSQTTILGLHYGVMMGHLPMVRSAWGPARPILLDEEGLFPSVRGQYSDDSTLQYGSAFGNKMGMMAGLADLFAYLFKLGGGQGVHREHDFASVWAGVQQAPVMGAVVWNGIDYAGEPNPNKWPATGSSFGARDAVGIPKDYYWAVRAAFRMSERLVHILPHWTWPGHEGKKLRTWVVSNCHSVLLEVNGKAVAKELVSDLRVKFEGDQALTYEPGVIVAKGLDRDGTVVASHEVHTAGGPERIRICELPRSKIAAGGSDVVCVRVRIEDKNGELCPRASDLVRFEISTGPGKIVGVGNGDPSSLEPQKADWRRAFRGYATALVQSTGGETGVVKFRAWADGLIDDTTVIEVVKDGQEEDAAKTASEVDVVGHHMILEASVGST